MIPIVKKFSIHLTLALIAMVMLPGLGQAQQRYKVSFNSPAENNKYTQLYTIEVGDAPGHKLRMLELLRSYNENPPLIEGVALKEAWIRGFTDYTDSNGLGTSYVTYVMANGDKIFARGNFLAHRLSGTDGKVGS